MYQLLFMTHPFLSLTAVEGIGQHLIIFLLLVVDLLQVILFHFGHLVFDFKILRFKFSSILSRIRTPFRLLETHYELMIHCVLILADLCRAVHFGRSRLNWVGLQSLNMYG